MSFFTKKSIFLSIFVLIIAILWNIQVEENKWKTTQGVLLKANVNEVFKFVTNTDYMEKWLPGISYVKPADNRPLDVKKLYFALFEIPLYGSYQVLFEVKDYKHNQLIALETESFLKTKVKFTFEVVKQNETRMKLSVSHECLSVLYQYTVGPIIKLVSFQQVQHSLFTLRLVFPY